MGETVRTAIVDIERKDRVHGIVGWRIFSLMSLNDVLII
jgi:hypothetical protein